MFKIHLLTALRIFQKQKSTFVINLIGLSTGLLCTLLIFLWVQSEVAVNQFHKDSGLIFQVMEHQKYSGGDMFTTSSTPGILAAELKKEVPEVTFATTMSWNMEILFSVKDKHYKESGIYADTDLFQILTIPIVEGDIKEMLRKSEAVAISKPLADKLFPNQDPIGQLVKLDQKKSYEVIAVFETFPKGKSTINFDFVLNAENWRDEEGWLKSWGSNGPRTMVKLQKGASFKEVNVRIEDFIKMRNEGSVVDLFLYPFKRLYLHGNFVNGYQQGGRIEYVRMFSIIALFILIIACINFMNLATAKASRKAREVGIRKALGANRQSLIYQYLIESILVSVMAMGIALLVIPLVLPYFNDLTGKSLVFEMSLTNWVVLLSIVLFTGILAGSYPALYLSSFHPGRVIKNDIKSSLGELWARKGLVVFQFVASIFLIVAVMVVYKQIDYVQNTQLGINKENLLRFTLDGDLAKEHDAFFNDLSRNPRVMGAAASAHGFYGRNNNTGDVNWPGKSEDQTVLFERMGVDYETLPLLGVNLIAGRNFSRDFATDTAAIIVNKTALDAMQLAEPLGTVIQLNNQDYRIIGVTDDFHFQSLREKVAPAVFIISDYWVYGFARIQSDEVLKTMQEIEASFNQYNPGFIFEYQFMDQRFNDMYQSETRVARLSQYFAGFAVLISCLGLFGLAAFTAERRIKEVGIRKVLGASIPALMILLSMDFARLVFLAILLALPLAYWVSSDWLNQFAYHIDLSIWYFLLSGLIAMVIAIATVSSQAYLAATVNPADCLKDE